MKLGTLTLHLPFNYGNALQQYSLHKYLLEHGYDAEIFSHWFLENRDEILYYHNRLKQNKFYWIRFLLHCLMFNGVFTQYIREKKIKKWLDKNIKWSEANGTDKTFPVNEIPHDVIITGSDQVWNPIHSTSDFFLLHKFPSRIRKVAYAASLGSDVFPEARKAFYRDALKNFEAISVRESSAVDILRQLGYNSTLICDPTLLHSKEEWCKLLDIQLPEVTKNELVMYLVTPEHRGMWQETIRLAHESGKRIHVYVFSFTQVTISNWRPIRKGLRIFVRNIRLRLRLYFAGVRLHFSADPTDFVQRIASSEGLITDSFHGMMFATIFEKKCNVIIGEHPERQQMSARLRNFTRDFGNPDILTPKADISAMRKLSISAQLKKLITDSKEWLHRTLKDIENEHNINVKKPEMK